MGMKAKDEENIIRSLMELREYDVPYHIRVCIDNEIRVSSWYQLQTDG